MKRKRNQYRRKLKFYMKQKRKQQPIGEVVSFGDIINMVIAFLTFLSVIGLFATINEMKRDRDAAYLPAIVMNAMDIEFSWDEEGKEEWAIFDESISSRTTTEKSNDGTYTTKIPMSLITAGSLYDYTVVNIGVGTAKNIVFEWDENNTQHLVDYLTMCDVNKADFCNIGDKSVVFSFDNQHIMTDRESPIQLMYMLPEATETYSLFLPAQYTVLIHEIIKTGNLDNMQPPHLVLYASYEDVQGKQINNIFYITINKLFIHTDESGSGSAVYQLRPIILD